MNLYDPSRYAKMTIELFDKGERTVTFRNWAEQLHREFDADFQNRLVDLVPEVAALVEASGYPCVPINEYCVRHFKDVAVHTGPEARRCNAFNSGGKRAVGIRHALPDGDLVRGEVNGSFSHLSLGGVKSAAQRNINDVVRGIATPEQHQQLIAQVRRKVPEIVGVQAEAFQQRLSESDDEEF